MSRREYPITQSAFEAGLSEENWYDHVIAGSTPAAGRSWLIRRNVSVDAPLGEQRPLGAGYLASSTIPFFNNRMPIVGYPSAVADGEFSHDDTGNANDDIAGTGAQKVQLLTIQSDWTYNAAEIDTVTLDFGAELSVNNGMALIDAYVSQAGTGHTNAGTITFHEFGAGISNYGQIEANIGKAHLPVMATAEGYDCLASLHMQDIPALVDVRLVVIDENYDYTSHKLLGGPAGGGSIGPIYVPEKSVIVVWVNNADSSNQKVAGTFDVLLRKR